MANLLLTDENLKSFIQSLKLSSEQENFLVDGLPNMNEKERLDLLKTLKDVYLLNEEEARAVEKVKKIGNK